MIIQVWYASCIMISKADSIDPLSRRHPLKHTHLSTAFIITMFSMLWSNAPIPMANWYSLGLEDQTIHCLIADDTTMILAGSDSGVSVRYEKKWFRAAGVRMPVSAMVRVSPESVVAAMGNGSKSDGLYIGTKIRGEPYYQFALLCYMSNPQALSITGGKSDTLYAGNSDELYRCVLLNDLTDPTVKPEIIKIPPNSFGVEMPTCKAIVAAQGQLLAGGYDRSPMPGNAHLLINVKDSMQILRPMNIAAMTVTNRGPEAKTPINLIVGTIDSGIYTGYTVFPNPDPAPTKPWTRYDSPNKEPINDLIAISITTIAVRPITEAFLVAVKSGVFWGTNGAWTELGSIPVVPRCLSDYGNTSDSYCAGTDKGVYRYGILSTGIQKACGSDNRTSSSIGLTGAVSGNARLAFTVTRPDRWIIRLYDIFGRRISPVFEGVLPAGEHSIALPFNNIGQGQYILSIAGSNGAAINRIVTLEK
jgi:hypothetical protein